MSNANQRKMQDLKEIVLMVSSSQANNTWIRIGCPVRAGNWSDIADILPVTGVREVRVSLMSAFIQNRPNNSMISIGVPQRWFLFLPVCQPFFLPCKMIHSAGFGIDQGQIIQVEAAFT